MAREHRREQRERTRDYRGRPASTEALKLAFGRAYDLWREGLVTQDEGGRPWADLTGDELLRLLLRELAAPAGAASSQQHT